MALKLLVNASPKFLPFILASIPSNTPITNPPSNLNIPTIGAKNTIITSATLPNTSGQRSIAAVTTAIAAGIGAKYNASPASAIPTTFNTLTISSQWVTIFLIASSNQLTICSMYGARFDNAFCNPFSITAFNSSNLSPARSMAAKSASLTATPISSIFLRNASADSVISDILAPVLPNKSIATELRSASFGIADNARVTSLNVLSRL